MVLATYPYVSFSAGTIARPLIIQTTTFCFSDLNQDPEETHTGLLEVLQ